MADPTQRILIADDAVSVAHVLQRFLTREGFRVDTVQDGEAALARMRAQGPPDLVIADVTMPRLDGRELVRAMRADKRLCGVPAVLMSGLPPRPEDEAAHGQYAAWIVKPFTLQQVLVAVRSALGVSA